MGHALRLLILDDQPADAELAAHLISNGGFPCTWQRVQTEKAFRSGLQTFQPDLILSDFTLPGYNGMSALELATREAPHTPFIFVSGSIGERRAGEALKRGATDYVPKTALAKLVPAVRRALSQGTSNVEVSSSVSAAHRLRRLHGVLDAISRFRASAAAIRVRSALLHEACHFLHASGQYDYAFGVLAHPESREARSVAWMGMGADSGRNARFSIGATAKEDTSITGCVLRTGEALIYFDSDEYPGAICPSEEASLAGCSILAFPLVAGGIIQGALGLGAATLSCISEPELLIIDKFTHELAHALAPLC